MTPSRAHVHVHVRIRRLRALWMLVGIAWCALAAGWTVCGVMWWRVLHG